MFVDFLISLWVAVCDGLDKILPDSGDAHITPPAAVSQAMGILWYYVDPTPIKVFFGLLFTILLGLIIYKMVNILFNWISGLL